MAVAVGRCDAALSELAKRRKKQTTLANNQGVHAGCQGGSHQ